MDLGSDQAATRQTASEGKREQEIVSPPWTGTQATSNSNEMKPRRSSRQDEKSRMATAAGGGQRPLWSPEAALT